jgi:hypothetical protein
MTLNKLHKILGKLIDEGCGRYQVSVHKTSFQDNRESDGCVILPVAEVEAYLVPEADDDGGLAVNKDGTERLRGTVVLGGCAYERAIQRRGQ